MQTGVARQASPASGPKERRGASARSIEAGNTSISAPILGSLEPIGVNYRCTFCREGGDVKNVKDPPHSLYAPPGRRGRTEKLFRKVLVRDEAPLLQQDELIQHQALLSRESDHRLLNGLQMIVSLLSLQSRASGNAEVASQLADAADRVATIARIHRRLHSFDGVQTFAIKQYLEDLGRDFTMVLSAEQRGRIIVVQGSEIELQAATASSLGFIAAELLTNAVKHGTGRITVSLKPNSEKGYALSVSNDGPNLPEEFDLASSKGLGMKIVRSLVEEIGGELRFGRGDGNQGAKFVVLFS